VGEHVLAVAKQHLRSGEVVVRGREHSIFNLQSLLTVLLFAQTEGLDSIEGDGTESDNHPETALVLGGTEVED
jgi:hypothetical protein